MVIGNSPKYSTVDYFWRALSPKRTARLPILLVRFVRQNVWTKMYDRNRMVCMWKRMIENVRSENRWWAYILECLGNNIVNKLPSEFAHGFNATMPTSRVRSWAHDWRMFGASHAVEHWEFLVRPIARIDLNFPSNAWSEDQWEFAVRPMVWDQRELQVRPVAVASMIISN